MEPDKDQLRAFGEFVKAQRKLAQISQRNLAKSAGFSDSYLSQLERGMYMPSPQMVRALADAIGVPASVLLAQLGLLDDDEGRPGGVEEAIHAETRLTPAQREALITVYRSYLAAAQHA